MFNYIKGSLISIEKDIAVVEVNGVGYELFISNQSASELTVGSETLLHCYLQVREDGVSLFGFSEKSEKNMFLRLISISGVGPKLALTVLSGLKTSSLTSAIINGDVAGLSRIKGIGKKTAERIILELKGKLSDEFSSEALGSGSTEGGAASSDAVLALMSLGLKVAEAERAVKRVAGSENMTVEEIIIKALK